MTVVMATPTSPIPRPHRRHRRVDILDENAPKPSPATAPKNKGEPKYARIASSSRKSNTMWYCGNERPVRQYQPPKRDDFDIGLRVLMRHVVE